MCSNMSAERGRVSGCIAMTQACGLGGGAITYIITGNRIKWQLRATRRRPPPAARPQPTLSTLPV